MAAVLCFPLEIIFLLKLSVQITGLFESFYVLWSFGTVKIGREVVGREMGSWEEGGWKISKEKMAIDLLRLS